MHHSAHCGRIFGFETRAALIDLQLALCHDRLMGVSPCRISAALRRDLLRASTASRTGGAPKVALRLALDPVFFIECRPYFGRSEAG
jgi:hypothetical protein